VKQKYEHNNNDNNYSHYFFIGIAGTGMSALAQYLRFLGHEVSGSDRQFLYDMDSEIYKQFSEMGIKCYPQDAGGVTQNIDFVVVSTAIEESNIEYQKAISLNIPIIKRSSLLAKISSEKKTIAVAGTSGKSTTTAMIYHILDFNGYHPSLITGAGLNCLQEKNLPGNAWCGKGEWLVIESDESDGSIVNYKPEISVLLNIGRDHKEIPELLELFATFKSNTKKDFIINENVDLIKSLSQDNRNNFSTTKKAGFNGSNFLQDGFKIIFKCNNIDFEIPLIGIHNMENALAAVAVCAKAGVSIEDSAKALKSFKGIYRRLQFIGEKNNNVVIDDFAHNPDEIVAAVSAVQKMKKRLTAIFQPHGFGPLKFMHKELSEKVAGVLREDDSFYILDVYYAGGTVNKEISSEKVAEDISKLGKKAENVSKNELIKLFSDKAFEDEVILLMGARDPKLSDFAKEIFQVI